MNVSERSASNGGANDVLERTRGAKSEADVGLAGVKRPNVFRVSSRSGGSS